MNKSNLRRAIIIFTIITAFVHLSLTLGRFDPAFLANAIGYIVLMVVFFKWIPLPFLKGQEKLVWYVYMGFTAVTIVAYFAVAPNPLSNPVGLATKVIEAFLIYSLWQHKEN